MDFLLERSHYSLVTYGLRKQVNKTFATREAANEYMYKLIAKYNLVLKGVWDDGQNKTYHCSNNVEFYIQMI